MAPTNKVTMLEHWLAAPPPSTVSELSLSLTFSDLMWIGLIPPVQRLVFYELPISKSYFIDTIIPKLKNSLSLALKYFPALAGNLMIPPDSSKPEIRYVNGDSVPVVFAESSFRDFDYLVSDQGRNCSEFSPLVAQLPRSSNSSGSIKVPLLALQVTLFPEIGICIGISNNHVAGDGSTMYAFVKAWTMISKLGEDAISSSPGNEFLPFYDREVMKDTKELDDMFWKSVRNRLDLDSAVVDQAQSLPADTDKVRATFVVGLEDVRRLKNYVSNQRSSLKHLSTFTVVCSYIWICMLKSGNATADTLNEEEDEDEAEYFGFVADGRGRTDPPVPANYFGNCLTYCVGSAKNRELTGEAGLAIAAELIGEAIHKRLHEEGPFKGLDKFFSEYSKVNFKRLLSIAGSPRQNYYDMDFGWGKPRKFEFVSIDLTGALSLSGCREKGGLEVGLSMPKEKMEVFAAFFKGGLKAL